MIADFLKKHDGAMFLGIEVSSAKAAADYLKARNFDATDPEPGSYMKEGETTLLPPMWYSVLPADEPAAGKKGIILSYFLHRVRFRRTARKASCRGGDGSPNTAMGIHAVWFAVHDVESQLRTLRDAGLESDESREAKFLGAHGREVKAGQGVLLLLEPSDRICSGRVPIFRLRVSNASARRLSFARYAMFSQMISSIGSFEGGGAGAP